MYHHLKPPLLIDSRHVVRGRMFGETIALRQEPMWSLDLCTTRIGGKTAAFSGNCLLLMIACDAGGRAAMFFYVQRWGVFGRE